MGKTQILPAAMRYQTELANNIASLVSIGYEPDRSSFEEASTTVKELQSAIAALAEDLSHDHPHDPFEEAKHAAEDHLPAMLAVRAAADDLEALVADDLWPLPTYQEMLFIL
jgi:glutamine synthetase